MCRYTICEMSSFFKATIENKTTSVTTHETTCLLSQLLSKVTVTSCRSSAGILHGCLQQDGAPSHTAKNTLTYLRRENVTFIEPHMWSPNSQDLNPVRRLCCLGCPSTDGLSTSTIHDDQPAEAGNRQWVAQTIAAFHRSRHWSVASPAWVGRPAARGTNWTFDVKTAACELL